MCFGIRILSPFHLTTQIVSIQNLNWPRNAGTHAQSWFLERSSINVLFHICNILFHICKILKRFSILHSVMDNIHLYHLPTSRWKITKTLTVQLLYWPAISKDDTASLSQAGIKIMSAHAFLVFLRQLRSWMDTIWAVRWNGLKILIKKHMWKSKIRLLEQKLDKNPLCYLFLETPCTQLNCGE